MGREKRIQVSGSQESNYIDTQLTGSGRRRPSQSPARGPSTLLLGTPVCGFSASSHPNPSIWCNQTINLSMPSTETRTSMHFSGYLISKSSAQQENYLSSIQPKAWRRVPRGRQLRLTGSGATPSPQPDYPLS